MTAVASTSSLGSASSQVASGASSVQAAPEKKRGFSFADFVDIINPLQHIPIVSTIYRQLTGDEIGSVAKVAGGAIYGGMIGLGLAVADVVVEETTGKDPGDHVMAMLGIKSESDDPHDKPTALASAEASGVHAQVYGRPPQPSFASAQEPGNLALRSAIPTQAPGASASAAQTAQATHTSAETIQAAQTAQAAQAAPTSSQATQANAMAWFPAHPAGSVKPNAIASTAAKPTASPATAPVSQSTANAATTPNPAAATAASPAPTATPPVAAAPSAALSGTSPVAAPAGTVPKMDQTTFDALMRTLNDGKAIASVQASGSGATPKKRERDHATEPARTLATAGSGQPMPGANAPAVRGYDDALKAMGAALDRYQNSGGRIPPMVTVPRIPPGMR